MKKWAQELTALMALGAYPPVDPAGGSLRRTGSRKKRGGRRSRYSPKECANVRGKQRVNLRMLRKLKLDRRRR